MKAEFVSPAQLAERLGVPVGTVYRWVHEGSGPEVFKFGRTVRFKTVDVDRWIAAQRQHRTVVSLRRTG